VRTVATYILYFDTISIDVRLGFFPIEMVTYKDADLKSCVEFCGLQSLGCQLRRVVLWWRLGYYEKSKFNIELYEMLDRI